MDARSKARFEGTTPEPRAGLRGGCIKNSLNMPFDTLLNPDGTLKSKEELAEIYKNAGIAVDKTTYNTCGSGLTACVNILAQQVLGVPKICLYDGSWAEYGSVDEPQF